MIFYVFTPNNYSIFLYIFVIFFSRKKQAERASVSDVNTENGGPVRLWPPRELPKRWCWGTNLQQIKSFICQNVVNRYNRNVSCQFRKKKKKTPKQNYTKKYLIQIRRAYQELFYFSFSLVDLKSTVQCCFLWPLPLGFTYSHLSIGTATHSMKARDWMRRWVRVKRVPSTPCVCFLPCLLECRGRRWASDDSPPPLSPWWSQILPLMHCLSQHLPSSVWSFVSIFSPIYRIYIYIYRSWS